MSSFGSKRKARKITVQDDDDTPSIESLNPPPEPQEPALQPTFRSRKPNKQSALRRNITFGDESSKEETNSHPQNRTDEVEDQEDSGAPVRIRPSSTTKSTPAKTKKQQSSSRLSFGPSEIAADDDDAMILGEPASTAKKFGITASANENGGHRKGIAKNLPFNRLSVRSMEDDDDRPRYSKEYLSELQSATPNTPQDISKLQIAEEDEMSLDPSELEGAMIVDEPTSTSLTTGFPTGATSVLTEAEIRVKKERRARLAKQKSSRSGETDDFIPLSDDDNDGRREGDSYLTLLSRQGNNGKANTRLVAEDEDLGEGFDEFVEDGGLSLGRKAEREARKKHRAEMASMISAAEGAGSDGDDAASDDSEAERLAAFEAAQTRAGMDGLAEEREQQRKRLGAREGVVPVPPKITPLPDLSVLMEAFKARMRQKEADLIRLRGHVASLKAEREGILKREPEVQKLLNEAGERYRALMMPGSNSAGTGQDEGEGEGATAESKANNSNSNGDGDVNMDGSITAARTLLDQFREGPGTPGERGLESLGATPIRQTQMEA